ncbi:MAG TPA: protein kinase [Anaeromyxobacteraceae bacterium]|nr:protein kinase [Anaeromyxobacteraceae bacterium]
MGAKGARGKSAGDEGAREKSAGQESAGEGSAEGKPADEGGAEEKAADEQGAGAGDEESGGSGEPPAEGDRPVPGQISALLEQLARPEDEEPGEWAWPAVGSTMVGRYDLLREIDRGGFGVVFEAFDRKLGRLVALKAIRPGPRNLAEARREALEREAEAIAHLSHPNIVTLHDLGAGDHGPFLVMEMLHGGTLQERLARGPLPVAEAVDVAVDVARALAHAHELRVIHRDLKPSNVFLTEGGGVKVLDFGLANILGSGGMRGGGTPGYMAPEQWRHEAVDDRTDAFGLGVLLFEMLTGRLPYRVSQDRSAALDPGPPPTLDRPDAPPELKSLVSSALAKDPAERPRDGRAMMEGLLEVQRALAAREASATGAWPDRRRRMPPRMPRSGLIAAIAAVAVAAALVLIFWDSIFPAGEPARISVVVVDLSNDTGDPELDSLSGLFITSLQQSQLLVPLTRRQMLDTLARLGHRDVKRIDEALGRDIARQAQAKALLLISIHRFERVYAIEARVIDPSRDEYLFALKEEGAGKSSIPGMIDRISDRVRRGMRERGAVVRRSAIRVEAAITGSLAAYQHYFRSQECMYRASFGQSCAAELHEALADDPTFALAHYQLAVWEERHGGPRSAQVAATEAAVRYIARVPPKEQRLILAWKAHLDGKDDEAQSVLEQLAKEQPRDPEAVWEAGDLLYHRGDYARARPWFERLLELDPGHAWGLDHLVHSLGALRRGDDLRARLGAWKGAPQGHTILHAISAAHAWLGDYPAAAAAARREAEVGGALRAQEDLLFTGIVAGDYRGVETQLGDWVRPGSPAPAIGYWALAALDAYQGRRRQGLSRFDTMVRELGPEAADALFHSYRAHYLAGDGRPGPVWEEVRRLMAIDPMGAAAHAVSLAYLGDLEHASELAVHLRPGSPRQKTYQAVVLWQRGQRDEALRNLRELAASFPFEAEPHFALAPAYLHGDLAARSGADAEAVEALRRFQSLFIPAAMWRSWAYPRSLYLSAASLERLGRRAEALAHVEKLLDDWRGADPRLPLLEEARALRGRLAPGRETTAPAPR